MEGEGGGGGGGEELDSEEYEELIESMKTVNLKRGGNRTTAVKLMTQTRKRNH